MLKRAAATCSGPCPAPSKAWLALRGLRTLHLRVERSQANAKELVRRLSGHAAVEECTGFGGIVSIVLARGALAADLLTRKTKLWVHATSLGEVDRRSSGAAAGGPSR